MTNPLDAYRANFPPKMDVLARECVGYFGYGNGRMLAAQIDKPLGQPGPQGGNEIVGGCAECERAPECWEQTTARCREVLPALMEVADEITATGVRGKEWFDAWAVATGQPAGGGPNFVLPPTMLLTVENTSHGSFHTADQRYEGPPDRSSTPPA